MADIGDLRKAALVGPLLHGKEAAAHREQRAEPSSAMDTLQLVPDDGGVIADTEMGEL
jgi:hypothetical protein